jgi:uncharacterized protein YndB with AHSA1/START domain
MSAMAETNRDSAREIVTTRVFDAPREVVFQMWADADHLRQWWGPNGFTTTVQEMDFRPGGTWRFVLHGPDGANYDNEILYGEIVRPALLTYSHLSTPHFDVRVTFEEEGERTRLTVRMTFGSAEERDLVAEQFGAVEGLEQTLGRLDEWVADSFVVTREFDAPRELVFRVWTERDHLMHWFGPKGFRITSCTNDLRVGGTMHYNMVAPDGSEMWGRWVYRAIVPPERLEFVSSFSDPEGNLARVPFDDNWPPEMLASVTFQDDGGRTRVTVHWSARNASDLERRTFAAGQDSMDQGWGGTFEQLRKYLNEVRGNA